jgi:hypothetical protein
MLIAESQSTFRDFLAQRGKDPTRLLPEELLTLGFAFYAQPAPPMRCPPTMHRLATRCSFSGVLVRHSLVTMASATTSI